MTVLRVRDADRPVVGHIARNLSYYASRRMYPISERMSARCIVGSRSMSGSWSCYYFTVSKAALDAIASVMVLGGSALPRSM